VRKMEMDGVEPVEFSGKGGDICIWHTRLFHRSCHNYSDRLRMALFYDVAKKSVDARAYGSLRQHQHRHYKPEAMEGSLKAMEEHMRQQRGYPDSMPIGERSMWDDWSPEVQIVDETKLSPTNAATVGKL
jgi:ectoine hydroxylase-related dioxygenase (phytanoyl-CoA dioxygenase family)